jgi:hypothetical protein
MRSYGAAITTSASFFTLVSEKNWWLNPYDLFQRQRAAFASPGFWSVAKMPEAAAGIAAASSAGDIAESPVRYAAVMDKNILSVA